MSVGLAAVTALAFAARAHAAGTPLPFTQVHLDASSGSASLSSGHVVYNPSGGCSAKPSTLAVTTSLVAQPDGTAQFVMVTSQNRRFTGPVSMSGTQLELDLQVTDSTGTTVLTVTGYGTSFVGTANIDVAPGTPSECKLMYSVALALSGASGLTLEGVTGNPPPSSSPSAEPSSSASATPASPGTPGPVAVGSPRADMTLTVGAPPVPPTVGLAPRGTGSAGSGPPLALVIVLSLLAVLSAATAVVQVVRLHQEASRPG